MTFKKMERVHGDYVTLSRADRDVNPSGGNLGADTAGLWKIGLQDGNVE